MNTKRDLHLRQAWDWNKWEPITKIKKDAVWSSILVRGSLFATKAGHVLNDTIAQEELHQWKTKVYKLIVVLDDFHQRSTQLLNVTGILLRWVTWKTS